jgi:hypothetical protein
VSIFRKPQIAISNEPTRYQPKYQEYFAKAGEDDSIDAVDKQPVSRRVGTNEAIKVIVNLVSFNTVFKVIFFWF